jgi:LysM repeat protein
MITRTLLALLLVGLIFALMVSPSRAEGEPPELPPADPAIVEDIFERLNALRSRRGLQPYRINPALNAAAQDQAEWLVRTGIRAHRRPDGNTPSMRVRAAGYEFQGWCCGENYYMSIDATPDLVWSFWVGSPSHYVNLVHRDFKEVGLGMTTDGYRISYVMVFADPFDPTQQPEPTEAPPPPPANNIAAGNGEHIVQRGETLFRIAQRYGVTVRSLAAANGITNPSLIFPGQRLVIGQGAPSNTQTEEIQHNPEPPPDPAPPNSTDGTHIVQSGETLFRIALRYGVSVQALAVANGITNPQLIHPGQRLVMPDGQPAEEPSNGEVTHIQSNPGPPPVSTDGTHIVQSGETLFRIALRYGVSVQALAEANDIDDPRRIIAGQTLVIPVSGDE